jgi:hypothetical protein
MTTLSLLSNTYQPNRCLDPEGEDLPVSRYLEICEFDTNVLPQPEECDLFVRVIRSN